MVIRTGMAWIAEYGQSTAAICARFTSHPAATSLSPTLWQQASPSASTSNLASPLTLLKSSYRGLYTGIRPTRPRLCPHPPNYSFDTYRLVQRMEGEGEFTREGAEGVMNSLSEVLGDSVSSMVSSSVSSAEFEKVLYINSVDFNHLRNELTLKEQSENALLQSEVGRLEQETAKLKMRMGEELRRVTSGVRLELGMEKGRVRDMQGAQELKIKEADSRIDTEISLVKQGMETIQWDLFKTLFPLFCAGGALVFSYLRFVR